MKGTQQQQQKKKKKKKKQRRKKRRKKRRKRRTRTNSRSMIAAQNPTTVLVKMPKTMQRWKKMMTRVARRTALTELEEGKRQTTKTMTTMMTAKETPKMQKATAR